MSNVCNASTAARRDDISRKYFSEDEENAARNGHLVSIFSCTCFWPVVKAAGVAGMCAVRRHWNTRFRKAGGVSA